MLFSRVEEWIKRFLRMKPSLVQSPLTLCRVGPHAKLLACEDLLYFACWFPAQRDSVNGGSVCEVNCQSRSLWLSIDRRLSEFRQERLGPLITCQIKPLVRPLRVTKQTVCCWPSEVSLFLFATADSIHFSSCGASSCLCIFLPEGRMFLAGLWEWASATNTSVTEWVRQPNFRIGQTVITLSSSVIGLSKLISTNDRIKDTAYHYITV